MLSNLILGTWTGILPVSSSSKILLIFNFIFVNSHLKGYLDIPSQSVSKLPFDDISVQSGSNLIAFNITIINAHYSGIFSSNTNEISGVFEQNGYKFSLILNKTSNGSGYNIIRPQTPMRPFQYMEEEVKIVNSKANVTLSGTLTYLSQAKKPIALVLLAHGSGGHDRDETIYDHKPFMVIADQLTKRNIAVLRYDERGIAKSSGNFIAANDVDFAEDILAGVRFAQTNKVTAEVSNIGLIGHSKGGATALIAKNMSDLIKFIVFLGSMGVDGENILYMQTRLILKVG